MREHARSPERAWPGMPEAYRGNFLHGKAGCRTRGTCALGSSVCPKLSLYTNIGHGDLGLEHDHAGRVNTCPSDYSASKRRAVLPFSQHGRRVEPRCAPCGHPRSQHAYGNQHSGRARERRRITCLHRGPSPNRCASQAVVHDVARSAACGSSFAYAAPRHTTASARATFCNAVLRRRRRSKRIRAQAWVVTSCRPNNLPGLRLRAHRATGRATRTPDALRCHPATQWRSSSCCSAFRGLHPPRCSPERDPRTRRPAVHSRCISSCSSSGFTWTTGMRRYESSSMNSARVVPAISAASDWERSPCEYQSRAAATRISFTNSVGDNATPRALRPECQT
jgi:hypothetical protein